MLFREKYHPVVSAFPKIAGARACQGTKSASGCRIELSERIRRHLIHVRIGSGLVSLFGMGNKWKKSDFRPKEGCVYGNGILMCLGFFKDSNTGVFLALLLCYSSIIIFFYFFFFLIKIVY